nr:acyl-CoA thioesterase domain-containing protein [Desulfosarcina cetonica]
MSASFQLDESGFEHQDEMPFMKGPEDLEPEIEMARRFAGHLPRHIRDKVLCAKPIEVRPIDPVDPLHPERKAPASAYWFRAIGPMPDCRSVHQYMLAYASDFGMISNVLRPHGRVIWQPQMQVASLDHAMWFHREFRMEDWMLYAMHSPSASGARGLTIGRIFTRKGVLVASVVQEGLIRYHPDPA